MENQIYLVQSKASGFVEFQKVIFLQIKDYTKGKKLPTGRETMPVLMYIYS